MKSSGEDSVRLTIFVPKDTDLLLRTHLAQTGMRKGAISKFVADAVRWQLFHLNLEAGLAHNLDVPSEHPPNEAGSWPGDPLAPIFLSCVMTAGPSNNLLTGGVRKQLAPPVPREEHIHCAAYGTAQYFGLHSIYHA